MKRLWMVIPILITTFALTRGSPVQMGQHEIRSDSTYNADWMQMTVDAATNNLFLFGRKIGSSFARMASLDYDGEDTVGLAAKGGSSSFLHQPKIGVIPYNVTRACSIGRGGGGSGPFLLCFNLDGTASTYSGSAPSGTSFDAIYDPVNDNDVILGTGPTITTCNRVTEVCTLQAVAGATLNNGGTMFLHQPSVQLYLAMANSASVNELTLLVCSPDGLSCTRHDASNGQGPSSAILPRIWIHDPYVYVVAENQAQSSKLWLYRCTLDVATCDDFDISGPFHNTYAPNLHISQSGTLYAAAWVSAPISLIMIAACPTASLPSSCTHYNISYTTAGSYPPSIAANEALQRVYVGLTSEFAIISPSVPLDCSPFPLTDPRQDPNGDWDHRFVYPDYLATHTGACDAGYEMQGSVVRTCLPSNNQWTGGESGCVVNATTLTISVDKRTHVVTETILFSITTVGSHPTPGSTVPSVWLRLHGTQDRVFVPSTFTFFTGVFRVAATGASQAGSHVYELDFDEYTFTNEIMTFTPAPFAAGFTSSSFDTQALNFPGVTFGVRFTVELPLTDQYGNPIVFADANAALTQVDAALVVDGSTRVPQVVEIVESTLGVFWAVASVNPTVVGNVEFQFTYQNTPVSCAGCSSPLSSFPVNVTCPSQWSVLGTTCIQLECLPNSKNVAAANETFSRCVCERGFTLGSYNDNGLPLCSPCPSGADCAEGLDAPLASVAFYKTEEGDFVRCHRPKGCSGGSSVCEPGYEGYMCNTCESGYYSDSLANCVQCPQAADGVMAISLVAFFLASQLIALAIALGGVRSKAVDSSSSDYSFASYTDGDDARLEDIVPPIIRTSYDTTTDGTCQYDDSYMYGSGSGSYFSEQEEQEEERRLGLSKKVVAQRKRRKIPPTLGIIALTFQVVGIMATSRMEWSDEAQSVLNVFQLSNIDINLFASECSLDSFHVKYTVSLLVPFLIIAAAVVTLFVAKLACRVSALASMSLKSLVDSVIFTLAPLLYIPLSRASFILFDCTLLPNGDWVLDIDPGVPCFDAAWWDVLPVGLSVVVLFTLGIPAYFALVILRNRKSLFSRDVYRRYGPLYTLFRSSSALTGISDLVRRLAIVAISVFASNHVLLQIAVLFALFLFTTWHVASVRPYFYPIYNEVQIRLTLMLLLLLLLGTASYAERNTASNSSALFVSIVVCIVLLLVVSLHALVSDTIQIVRVRRNANKPQEDRINLLRVEFLRELRDLPQLTPQLLLLDQRGQGEDEDHQ